MKRRLSFWPVLALLVLLCVAVGSWLATRGPRPDGAGPLAGSDIGGPFALVDQDGRPATNESFDGDYRLMYFGYTYCPDICPVDVQKMVQGYRAFAAKHPGLAGKVRPIFVSVDPERDTPEVMKRFVSAFDPALVGLTGTSEQVARMLREYRIYAQAQRQPGQQDYLVDHSVMMYLMSPKGEPISFLAADSGPEQVTAELERYVS